MINLLMWCTRFSDEPESRFVLNCWLVYTAAFSMAVTHQWCGPRETSLNQKRFRPNMESIKHGERWLVVWEVERMKPTKGDVTTHKWHPSGTSWHPFSASSQVVLPEMYVRLCLCLSNTWNTIWCLKTEHPQHPMIHHDFPIFSHIFPMKFALHHLLGASFFHFQPDFSFSDQAACDFSSHRDAKMLVISALDTASSSSSYSRFGSWWSWLSPFGQRFHGDLCGRMWLKFWLRECWKGGTPLLFQWLWSCLHQTFGCPKVSETPGDHGRFAWQRLLRRAGNPSSAVELIGAALGEDSDVEIRRRTARLRSLPNPGGAQGGDVRGIWWSCAKVWRGALKTGWRRHAATRSWNVLEIASGTTDGAG